MSQFRRDDLPLLAVIVHDYLRDQGIQTLMQYARVAYIGPPDSRLGRLADVFIPVKSLDAIDAEESLRALLDREEQERGLRFDALLAIRDCNVLPAATIAHERGWAGPDPKALLPVARKSELRRWMDATMPEHLFTEVPHVRFERGMSEASFRSQLGDFAQDGPAIFKPDRGSCSFGVTPIEDSTDIDEAWASFRACDGYRGGDFVAERRIQGTEISVECAIGEVILAIQATGYLPKFTGSFAEAGHFVPSDLDAEQLESAITLVRAIHEGLGLNSMITHSELIVRDDGPPALVELNPRIGGDMIPELHKCSSGLDLYAIAAHIAIGRTVDPEFLTRPGPIGTALIRFVDATKGMVTVKPGAMSPLVGADDRVGLLFPVGARLTEPGTNDERPAFAFVVDRDGESVDSLADRAGEMLRHVRVVDADSMATC